MLKISLGDFLKAVSLVLVIGGAAISLKVDVAVLQTTVTAISSDLDAVKVKLGIKPLRAAENY